jgi:magnesium-transporting ATPase (P-type)
MKSINWGRVILGGVAAGVVVNISEYVLNEIVLKKTNEEAMKALGKTMPEGGGTIMVWLIWGFLLGIAAVWLYAGIRPRYGAGPATAVKAGVAVWFLAQLLTAIVFWNLGLFPMSPMILVWTLVEAVVATVAGAWVYKEEGA